jgi:hypothetical protein
MAVVSFQAPHSQSKGASHLDQKVHHQMNRQLAMTVLAFLMLLRFSLICQGADVDEGTILLHEWMRRLEVLVGGFLSVDLARYSLYHHSEIQAACEGVEQR